ncbi:hypothetical protein PV08_10400 [Exophiala spinifera]|uniref:Uncharacterized protein n=1 Tax=Exophiala spinifera TaxID=91928 RepID=A0A0D2AXF0_9EURO|nr:uncharacterized protein PV08_10400 [Exophiala spinifera]KIW11100.1 hypothetical protein PV08_10400 [Exophiala spinifera]
MHESISTSTVDVTGRHHSALDRRQIVDIANWRQRNVYDTFSRGGNPSRSTTNIHRRRGTAIDPSEEGTMSAPALGLTPTMARPHLLGLPGELRVKIWKLVFEDANAAPSRNSHRIYEESCFSCFEEQRPFPMTWNATFEPLLTCKQIYSEAHEILLSGMMIEIRNPIFDLSWLAWPLPPINHKVRRLVVWAHINGHNSRQWVSTCDLLKNAFPAMESLVVKAHMRPQEGAEETLDAAALAGSIVRLKHNNAGLAVTLEYGYRYHKSMWHNPRLGQITSHDIMEDNDRFVRDLIEDREFGEAALQAHRDDADEAALAMAFMRVTIAHEENLFEAMVRSREERQRLGEAKLASTQA